MNSTSDFAVHIFQVRYRILGRQPLVLKDIDGVVLYNCGKTINGKHTDHRVQEAHHRHGGGAGARGQVQVQAGLHHLLGPAVSITSSPASPLFSL